MAKARRDIDKESMYQKIMPSSLRDAAEEAAPAAAPQKEKKPAAPRARKAPHPVTISSRPAAPAPVTRLLEEQENTTGATAAEAQQAASPKAPAASQSSAAASTSIVNIMERLIEVKIGPAMDKFHCCTCEHCRQDITAFALNKLTPRYLVQDPELIAEAMEDKEANTQVTTALVQAILKVKANPKHA